MALYSLNRIKSDERDFRAALAAVQQDDFALLRPARPWAAFSGMFGIGSNEFVLMSTGSLADLDAATGRIGELDGVSIVTSHILEPTVRPTDTTPLTREGLYVFRFFDVFNKDVDEIAELSNEAWQTFEHTDNYNAEPQALFCQHDRSAARGLMLLLTWYDGLNSWQISRQPAPEARENFRRRHELTLGTVAFATRLIAD